MIQRFGVMVVFAICMLWAGDSAGQPRESMGRDPAGQRREPAQPRDAEARAARDPAVRGRYLVQIMDCGGCHTPGALAGQPDSKRHLGGSDIGFAGPWGVVYPRNLTPDQETGLGKWTGEELVQAIRAGKGRDGRTLAPIMPWPAYAALTDRDVRAIVAYLRTIPAVKFVVPKDARPGETTTAPYLDVVKPK